MTTVKIPSNGLSLEGRFRPVGREGAGGAVICHPHPRFGGSMNNNVVSALESALSAAGYSTLAFNFRGVGRSQGEYDDMRGETDDVISAWAWLAGQAGTDPSGMVLAGYSFGGYMALRAAARLIEAQRAGELPPPLRPPASLLLVSPMPGPPGWEGEVELLWQDPPPARIITGEYDEVCAPAFARGLARRLDAKLKVILGGDHFYFEGEDEIGRWVGEVRD